MQRAFFFTACDTRRCSWFRDVHLDTDEDTELIQTYKTISLKTQSETPDKWRTVADQFQAGLQWACITDTNTQNALEKLKPAYALKVKGWLRRNGFKVVITF